MTRESRDPVHRPRMGSAAAGGRSWWGPRRRRSRRLLRVCSAVFDGVGGQPGGCAAAMPVVGKVPAVEMVLPAGNEPSPAKTFDVLMLLQPPGAGIR